MAGVALKKDFTDGQKLYGQQLNNNFGVIEAALNAMNKIVWQDDTSDSIIAFRGTTAEINTRDIIDGQLLYDTTTGETYIDYGSQRISTGSGNAIHIGDDEPTNPSTQLWVDTDDPIQSIGSEVINSLSGDETNKSPSVKAVKDYIADVVEKGSNENGNWIKFSNGIMICYAKQSVTTSIQNSWGELKISSAIELNNFPQEFKEIPSCSIDVQEGYSALLINASNTTKTKPYDVQLVSGISTNSSTYVLSIMAIGEWK